jgi:hypothetical protein
MRRSAKAVVLTDDDLKRLERRFGTVVRRMGSWSSDGTFGYSSVPVSAIEGAAETLRDPNLTATLTALMKTPERTESFMELLDISGLALIEKIVEVYRQTSFTSVNGTPQPPKPPQPAEHSRPALKAAVA